MSHLFELPVALYNRREVFTSFTSTTHEKRRLSVIAIKQHRILSSAVLSSKTDEYHGDIPPPSNTMYKNRLHMGYIWEDRVSSCELSLASI
jgi:hypothetical protein